MFSTMHMQPAAQGRFMYWLTCNNDNNNNNNNNNNNSNNGNRKNNDSNWKYSSNQSYLGHSSSAPPAQVHLYFLYFSLFYQATYLLFVLLFILRWTCRHRGATTGTKDHQPRSRCQMAVTVLGLRQLPNHLRASSNVAASVSVSNAMADRTPEGIENTMADSGPEDLLDRMPERHKNVKNIAGPNGR